MLCKMGFIVEGSCQKEEEGFNPNSACSLVSQNPKNDDCFCFATARIALTEEE
jgi:hypothetical protein